MTIRRLVSSSDVHECPVRWLWGDRIPLGSITILDGDPCSGKSTITCDLAARVTTGRSMPECNETLPPAGVVLLQAEDNLGMTVLPNLRAVGADLERIRLFDRNLFLDQPFVLPNDLPLIEEAVREVQAKLVVIDPLTAFLTGNANNDMSIRKTFGPMAAFAERCDVAVLVVRHLRKSGTKNPLYDGKGSIDIIGIARAGLLVGPDPDSSDKYRHILAQSKGNLSDAASMCYRTQKHDDGTVTVEWLGPSRHTAADLAAGKIAADDHSALAEAHYVLYSILSKGRVPADEVIRLAKLAGISERTLKRAKCDLSVRSWKFGSGSGSRWFWELPNDEELLRPFKDQDLDNLINELIYSNAGQSLEGKNPECHPPHRHPGQQEDDGNEGCPTGQP
jgi:hypothetical protein